MDNSTSPTHFNHFGNSTTTGQTSDAPEVFVSPVEHQPYSFPQHNDQAYATAQGAELPAIPKPDEGTSATDLDEKAGKSWWKRTPFIIAIVVAVLVIAGLVAGIAVVATKNKSDSSSASDNQNGSPWNNITLGCSDHADTVDGTTKTTQRINARPIPIPATTFTLHCDQNADPDNVFSLFVPDFESCLIACATWNAQNTTNSTPCEVVTFAPSWSNKTFAINNDKADGDCYLKQKPNKNQQGLYPGDRNSFEVHSGWLKS